MVILMWDEKTQFKKLNSLPNPKYKTFQNENYSLCSISIFAWEAYGKGKNQD